MKRYILFFVLLWMSAACQEEGSTSGDDTGDGFDRSTLLISWADDIIIPGYQDLQSALVDLQAEKNSYLAGDSSLEDLKDVWLDAYIAWQGVEMFNIGPAEDALYGFQMNIYPTNINDIQVNISNGVYDLSSPNNNDAVGFPAVEYLLYSYENLAQDAAALQYLSDLIDRMLSLNTEVLDAWNNDYRDSFVQSTGNTASSSVNSIINDYIYYVEKGFRANKFGIPAGIFSATPLPDRVESYYAQIYSKTLALDALDAIELFFEGNPEGLSEYLNYLEAEDLTEEIETQIDIVRSAIEALNSNFAEQVETDNVKMLEAYDAIQRLVVLLKVDMMQELNISIDYVDADGD